MKKIAMPRDEYRMTEDDIIIQETINDIYLDLDLAKQGVEVFKKLAKGKRYPLLIISNVNSGISKEARKFYMGESLGEITPAVAMYSKSRIMKMASSFFLGFNKTPFPFKIFNDKTAAVKWLIDNKLKEEVGS